MKEIERFEAGHYESGYGYKYFVPNMIDEEWYWTDPAINKLLEKAAIVFRSPKQPKTTRNNQI